MIIDVIGKRNIFLSVAMFVVILSLFSVFYFGFQQGIDFVGGTLWHFVPEKGNISESEARTVFSEAGINEVVLTADIELGGYIVRFREISESEHQQILSSLREKFGEIKELRYGAIGPSIGNELRRKALISLGFVMLAIAMFVAFSFRKVSYPVSSWKYGIVTLATLVHDVALPAGVFALFGYLYGVEIDTNFIVALLVVLAFSVNDTIVVFDRIRENLLLSRRDVEFASVVNNSVNQTFARSINTSLSFIIVLLSLYFLGPATLQNLILAILIGVASGTYSSIFVASPLLVAWYNLGQNKT